MQIQRVDRRVRVGAQPGRRCCLTEQSFQDGECLKLRLASFGGTSGTMKLQR